MKKSRTNEQAFKELIKNMDSVLLALLRERVLAICELTEKESVNWNDNSFLHPSLYKRLNDEVKKYLGYEE
jgi:hypothetical protein